MPAVKKKHLNAGGEPLSKINSWLKPVACSSCKHTITLLIMYIFDLKNIYIYILYYTINSMHITGYTPYTYIAIPCWHPSPHWYRYVFPKLKNKDLEMEIKDPTTQQMSRFWMKASIFWWRIVVLICALNPQTSTVRGPRLQASGFVGFQKKPPLSRLQNQLWCIRYMKLL